MSTATIHAATIHTATINTATLNRAIISSASAQRVQRASSVGTQRPGRLRMTRRGRTTLALAIALPLIGGAWFAVGANDGAIATNSQASTVFEYVQVESGQSLWQIASAIAPTEDPRDVVSEIVRLNGLSSSDVFPGQRLAVPEVYGR